VPLALALRHLLVRAGVGMTVSPGYPNYDEVAKARQGAMGAIALGQAVAVDHARVLLAALAF